MERIQLFRKKDKLGSFVRCEDYDIVSEFLLEAVHARGTVTLTQLVDLANSIDDDKKLKLCSLLLLDIKQDLEVRGKIKVERLPNRVQLIQLNKKNGRTQINIYMNDLSSKTIQ